MIKLGTQHDMLHIDKICQNEGTIGFHSAGLNKREHQSSNGVRKKTASIDTKEQKWRRVQHKDIEVMFQQQIERQCGWCNLLVGEVPAGAHRYTVIDNKGAFFQIKIEDEENS